jgi:hypothetical protein
MILLSFSLVHSWYGSHFPSDWELFLPSSIEQPRSYSRLSFQLEVYDEMVGFSV